MPECNPHRDGSSRINEGSGTHGTSKSVLHISPSPSAFDLVLPFALVALVSHLVLHASSASGAANQGHRDIAQLLFEHGVGVRDVHEDGSEPIREWTRPSVHMETGARDARPHLSLLLLFARAAWHASSAVQVRACFGHEEKHTATVAWFLDHGVPLEEVYDKCKTTSNPGTIDLLQDRLMGDD